MHRIDSILRFLPRLKLEAAAREFLADCLGGGNRVRPSGRRMQPPMTLQANHQRRSGLRQIPDLPSFLGGTCYANNYHLTGLLRALGYAADLCAADTSQPDVHLANIVRLDGREYVVDAGYGAPFLSPTSHACRVRITPELFV